MDRRSFIVWGGVVTLGSVLEACGSSSSSTTAKPSRGFTSTTLQNAAKTGWALTWSDEFNEPAGTKPDPAKWTYKLGGKDNGNKELQFYTDSARERLDRRERQPRLHGDQGDTAGLDMLVRHVPVHVGQDLDEEQVQPAIRALRGAPPGAPGPGHLAGVLDARRRP